jgi:uncharacterized membrane protein
VSIDVIAEVRIRRPRAAVFAFMSDPSNDLQWIGGLRSVRLLGDPPPRVGSRVARVASFLGRRVEYVNEITALEPPSRLEMRSVAAPFPMHITYTFDAAPDDAGATLVRNHVRGGSGRLFSIASPLMAPLVRRNVQRDLERLRDVLESQPA